LDGVVSLSEAVSAKSVDQPVVMRAEKGRGARSAIPNRKKSEDGWPSSVRRDKHPSETDCDDSCRDVMV
jgi:hypothetical protein